MEMTKQRQLTIRSDEAHALATTLAERQGLTAEEVVIRALRDYARADEEVRNGLTAEQEAFSRRIVELGRQFRSQWKYGEGSDHSDMYDEYGLPI
jgi:hypothetical protein